MFIDKIRCLLYTHCVIMFLKRDFYLKFYESILIIQSMSFYFKLPAKFNY